MHEKRHRTFWFMSGIDVMSRTPEVLLEGRETNRVREMTKMPNSHRAGMDAARSVMIALSAINGG